MLGRRSSENRQRTKAVLVRLTPAEHALVLAVQAHVNARGAGTVLRDAFMKQWVVVIDETQEIFRRRQDAPGTAGRTPERPDTAPALPAAQRPAQARAGAAEPNPGGAAAS